MIKMIKGFLIIFILCNTILTSTSIGQDNFLPGYIIQNAGDTIHGYIDYRKWSINPSSINFKKKFDDGILTYSPLDIKYFIVGDEIYTSAIVDINISPTRTSNLHDYESPDIIKDTTFLNTLVSGPKPLFYYRDETHRKHFYILQDGSYELLIYKKYIDKSTFNNIVSENNYYKGQLNNYLRDCKSLQERLRQSSYDVRSLRGLFVSYQNCTGAELYFHEGLKNKLFRNFSNAIQLYPFSLLGGVLNVNYEHVYNKRHGFVLGGFVSIPLELKSKGISVSYRHYNNQSMNSGFLGAFINYRNAEGKVTEFSGLTSASYGFTQSTYSIGPNIGKRWVANSGFSVVFRIGYGYPVVSNTNWTDGVPSDELKSDTEKVSKYLAGVDLELSIGRCFK